MSSNPDEIYRAQAALEPVAPVTLWLYPQLRLVRGCMQRSVLEIASRKATKPWLFRMLMLGYVSAAAFRIWAHETGRPELWRITDNAVVAFILVMLILLIFQFLRTRKFLRLEVSPQSEADVPSDKSRERTRGE
jgi:hypothetical protein